MTASTNAASPKMDKTGQNDGLRKRFLGTSILSSQNTAPSDYLCRKSYEPEDVVQVIEENERPQETVVVTGSRIRRQSFWSTTAIEVLRPIHDVSLATVSKIEPEPALLTDSRCYPGNAKGLDSAVLHRAINPGAARTLVLVNGRRVQPGLESEEEHTLFDLLSLFNIDQNVKLDFVHRLGEVYRHFHSGAATAKTLSEQLIKLFRTVTDSTRKATRLAYIFALRFVAQIRRSGAFQEIVEKFADPPDDVGESQTFCGNRAAYGVLSKNSRSGNSPQATKSHSVLPFQPA